ncbi:MAG: sigma-70 family RNA polymerase sigma factor [Lachnospiraceae bacterium]|nr:sigma-70 family RNA polymerase sigma factor [Lachnospiraceae bacterium]
MDREKKEQLMDAFRRFQMGENEAFNEVYSLTQKLERYVAWSVCHDWELAEDALQETYISIIQYKDRLENLEAIEGWIGRIAGNKVRDMWRKNAKTTLLSEEEQFLFDEQEEPDVLKLPWEAADSRETQRLIRDILDRLPEEQRLVLTECEYNGLKVREVAEYYGVPEGTVKTWRRKAKAAVKAEVERLYREEDTRLYTVLEDMAIYWAIHFAVLETEEREMPAKVAQCLASLEREKTPERERLLH